MELARTQHRAFRDGSALAEEGACSDVTIVLPCLNEVQSLPHCIANALDALAMLRTELGMSGEIVIADNGSTDGSQALASELGARVVPVTERGYGAALIGGCSAASGRYILMGDCDGSYNFLEGIAMVAQLDAGYDLCMGNRFKGGITPGAMPWKNRYIGNPGLSGVLNLLFRSGIGDAHCGLRAIRKEAFERLRLSGSGMEFASEMVIKAALLRLRVTEVPATLSRDLRDRAPHLRPWRDGWRHLRYLFMLSPTWVFGVPGAACLGLAGVIFGVALLHLLGVLGGATMFGTSWTIIAGFLTTCGHFALIMAVATHLFGVRQGYRLIRPALRASSGWLTLEMMLVSGIALIGAGLLGLLAVTVWWGQGGFVALETQLPLILFATSAAVGLQNVLGGFVLSVIAGNDNRFAPEA
ncbi:glycosyltransferase involved in cell wall biosynthesis [Blastomonas natatoria]|uniref:Glycosyltransferase involved in cell wall biosynthesis n=1 Tax=Blastomonas natatoria TaxID=34015 RepID=A0A2V3VDP9_9SPHN|nr:glycosyltransferase [Blastomonas natatoria]PXW78175.1 glycosyltransferase involved in cell wall biosynthesis [Blastomonas natatoria]